MTAGRKEHYLNETFSTLNYSTFSSFLFSVIVYFQPFYNKQMLNKRVDLNIILLETILKNAAAMKHILGNFERKRNWRICQIFNRNYC
jgi:hypothetical protein